MLNENFVVVGAIINLLGGASYIKDTVQGKVKPNRISWGLWSVAVAIAFSAELSEGVGLQSLATFMVGFVPLLIFLSSFINKKSYWKLGRFDFLCGAFSVAGLILWVITKSGNWAILFSIFADLSAGVPTLVKAYKFPETENWIEYAGSFISVFLTILTLKSWTFAHWAFPLYIFIFDIAGFFLIKFKLGKQIDTLLDKR